MSDQARKHVLGLAGEFLVAGEILRRGITAVVTYGNAKKADVIAILGNYATSVEVKTSSENKWIVGNQIPEPSSDLWVFVYLPTDETSAPEYFVLTAYELHKIVKQDDDNYRARYFERNGKDFIGTGVISLRRETAVGHKGSWDKVKASLMEIES